MYRPASAAWAAPPPCTTSCPPTAAAINCRHRRLHQCGTPGALLPQPPPAQLPLSSAPTQLALSLRSALAAKEAAKAAGHVGNAEAACELCQALEHRALRAELLIVPIQQVLVPDEQAESIGASLHCGQGWEKGKRGMSGSVGGCHICRLKVQAPLTKGRPSSSQRRAVAKHTSASALLCTSTLLSASPAPQASNRAQSVPPTTDSECHPPPGPLRKAAAAVQSTALPGPGSPSRPVQQRGHAYGRRV